MKKQSSFILIFFLCISCGIQEKKNNTSKREKVSETQLDTAIIYKIVEHMPRFKTCDPPTLDKNQAKKCSDSTLINYIMKNLRYPLDEEKGGSFSGVVRFIINEDGSVSDVESLREFVAEESLVEIVAKMPKWEKPGIHQGEAVKVSFTLPLKIKPSY